MERATVRVNGVVQSVGFRPFVYRTAVDLGLGGSVRNRGDAGALVELEGPREDVDGFLDALREDNPPLARVGTIETERERVPEAEAQFTSFEIVESDGGGEGGSGDGGGTIPPDTAMCGACVADMRDPDSRYHGYWATACLDCGPRFTVIESLPYDRPATSMAAFPLCADCRNEYEEPADRRYHAQTIACPQCGPTLRYVPASAAGTASTAVGERPPPGDRDPFPDDSADALAGGREAAIEAPAAVAGGRAAIGAAADALADGNVVVLKGIGGAHLACDATNEDAVARLRERTGRSEKPFALMAADAEMVGSFASPSPAERDALTSPRRPIVLLEEDGTAPLASGVAPGLHTVGAMVPYAGVHHLLFDELDAPVVMTSANLPGRPMLTRNGAMLAGLDGVADGFLLHDRRIVARCDDSVARLVDGDRRLLRRSRGFAPLPVPVSRAGDGDGDDVAVLGLGPELDVAAGVLSGEECYLTQYVGNVDDVDTFESFVGAIDHLLGVTGLDRPRVVARDAHPGFRTTEYAERLAADESSPASRVIEVQHHHAHAASVLAEHDVDAAIAVVVDGVGYGPDGTVWGGEVLDATRADYERVGGLSPTSMPGGDRATRYPARMLAGVLHRRDADTRRDADALEALLAEHVAFPRGAEEREVVLQQLDAGVNAPTTTSAGRFLDAASALLGVCEERTYEGEPAMKLEALAARGTARGIELPYATVDGRPVLDTPRLMDRLVELLDDAERADVAATAQDALARGLARIAVDAAEERDRDTVVLSGGVAYNDAIATRVRETVVDAGLRFLGNERVPPGDGGIAYGQVAVAAARVAGRDAD
ncbi:carbamoyltransferase HypF [Halobacteriales archaeon QS_4_69_34]|nr:MAG: carbamoyltransferase HypF [Halobacteriales archaeon QS_4_69_34]